MSSSKRSYGEAFNADEMLTHIRQLRREAGGGEPFAKALSTLETMLSNLLEHPKEPRYRTIRLNNSSFHERLGRFASGVALLRAVGFEDAYGDATKAAGAPTHLALPVADAPMLAQTVVLLAAAAEAAASIDDPTAAPAAAVAAPAALASESRAESKRPMARSVTAPEARSSSEGSPFATNQLLGPSSSSAGTSEEGLPAPIGSRPAVCSDGEATVELSDYSAAGINAFFQSLAGPTGEGLASLSPANFDPLARTARDAAEVARSTGDVDAAATADGWLETLREHGAVIGWSDEIDSGDEAGHATDGHGETDGGAAGDGVLGAYGNLDTCAVCGSPGLLVCCDGCPMAYHMACLSTEMRPPEGVDEAEWLCPSCQTGKRIGAGEH
jgi:hypothetical protein